MRTLVVLLLAGMTFMGCRSNEKMMNRDRRYISTQPVNLVVQENVRDTIVVEEKTVPVRQEAVTLTQGADLMRYCIIVGSFLYEQNAVNLRNELMRQGFWNSSIMRNSEGMYRVSVACDEDHEAAWKEVYRIRSQYPQFRDAWVLGVKK